MADKNIQKTLHDRFLELPEKIREWLTSERATFTVIEINKKLGLFGEDLKVIPRLIARFVIKDLNPENFIKELSESLGIDRNSVGIIAQDIFQRIFKPIDLQLKEIGVFPALIFPNLSQQTPQKPETPTAPAVPPRPQPVPPPPVPPQPPVVKVPFNVTSPKPPLPPIQNKNLESNN